MADDPTHEMTTRRRGAKMNYFRKGSIALLLMVLPSFDLRPAVAQENRAGFEAVRIEISSDDESSLRKSVLDAKLEPALVASVALARSQRKDLASSLILAIPASGQLPAARELKGRVISIEHGDFHPIPLQGVKVALRIQGVAPALEQIGARASTNENGRFIIPLPQGLNDHQQVDLEQDNLNYGVLYPRLGKLELPKELDDVLEVRMLPRGSERWLSNERIEDLAYGTRELSAIIRTLARQSGFAQDEVQRKITKWSSDRGNNAGFEEFTIGVKSSLEPSPNGGEPAVVWHVELLSCPVQAYNGTTATIKSPKFTRTHLNNLRRRTGKEPNLDRIRGIGDAVRESLFDAQLMNALMASTAIAKRDENRLRITVVLKGNQKADAPIIPAEVPIEAIHFSQPVLFDEFPATDRSFTVSRRLDQPPIESLIVDYPIRMLVVTPSPTDKLGTAADDARLAIREGLKGLAFDEEGKPLDNGAVRVRFCEPPTWDTFRRLIRDERPHIVHFAGHGAFDAGVDDPSKRAQIVFERPETRQSDPVGAEDMKLELQDPNLKLVVLTACSTAAPRPVDPEPSDYPAYAFDGLAQKLLSSQNISAVVAMQFDLEVKAARVFAREFYRSLLADGQDVDVAVTQTRRELAGTFRVNSGIWITPVLYSRCRNGRVFEFPAKLGLAGIVLDAEKAQRIAGIELNIVDLKDIYGKTPTIITDNAGQFRFQGLPPGPARHVRLATTKPGYRLSPSTAQLGNTSCRIELISDKPETR
jgi:CHAT domain